MMPQAGGDGFGQRLRYWRLEAGLTQEELAEKSQLSVRAISDIESGRTSRPRRRSVDRIADALQIPDAERKQIMNALRQSELSRQVVPAGHVPRKPAPAGPDPVVPRQLPNVATHFTGRVPELKKLNELLDLADAQPAETTVIAAIVGTAGVGKSALAVRWAYHVAERFPDGQLYVNLRGYDPAQPMTASEALARFLRALGVRGQDIPLDADEQAALYRSLISGRRVLVVADNAGSVEQVRPLLPPGPRCAAIVTSRDALAGLVAREGAWRLALDQLPLAEALDLLRALIGERVDGDPGATAVLAAQCGRLPLTLRVAAELVTSRPATPLADVVSELADQKRRLDLLSADGDPRTAIRAVFTWSYRVLDPDTRRAFRLVGLNPGPDIDRYATAALTGTTVDDARRVLDTLARAHLIQVAEPGRFGLHDMLRAFASDLAASHDSADARHAALTRLFGHYLEVSAAAIHNLFPGDYRGPASRLPPTAPAQLLDDPGNTRAWLDGQRANLLAAARHMSDLGWPDGATRLADVLHRYLESTDLYPEATAFHSYAREAARHTGDRGAEATALSNLGLIDLRQGRYQAATEHFLQARRLFQETPDRIGEARVLGNLGLIHFQEGNYQESSASLQRSRVLYRECGDNTGEARQLTNLGLVEERQGHCEKAAEYHRQALNVFRENGYKGGQAYPLANLGDVYLRQRLYQKAIDHYREALSLFRECHNRTGEAYVLTQLGDVSLRLLGQHQQAAGQHRQALALYHRTGDQSGQAQALNGLGESSLAAGRPAQARTQHSVALRLASQIGDKYQEARAHHGLGRVHHGEGDPAGSRRHWRKAYTLYSDLGAPEAAEVHAELTTEGHPTQG